MPIYNVYCITILYNHNMLTVSYKIETKNKHHLKPNMLNYFPSVESKIL